MINRLRPRIRVFTILLLCWAPAPTVHAAADAPATKPYASVGVGWSYAEPFVMDDNHAVINYDFNPSVASFAGGLSVFGHWRFELEALLMDNAPEVLYVRGTDIELDTKAGDKLNTTSFLLNVYRDFPVGTVLRPYLGFGLGAANVELRYTEYTPVPVFENPLIDDDTWTFAYQIVAGLTVPLGQHFGVGAEYRYWRAPDVALEDLTGSPLSGGQGIHSGWLRLSYQPGGYDWPAADPAKVPGSGFYLSGTLGTMWSPDRDFIGAGGQFDAFDIGPMGTFAVGYQFDGHWRLELEAGRYRTEMEIYDTRVEETRTKGEVVGDMLSANIGYRFRPHRAVQPYIVLGLGAGRIDYEVNVAQGRSAMIDDTVHPLILRWQLGVDLALSARWTISTGYSGVFSDQFTLDRTDGDTITTTYLAHAMTVGARYQL